MLKHLSETETLKRFFRPPENPPESDKEPSGSISVFPVTPLDLPSETFNNALNRREWGYINYQEVISIKVAGIFEVDCEPENLWKIRPAKEVDLICKAQGWDQDLYIMDKQKEITNG